MIWNWARWQSRSICTRVRSFSASPHRFFSATTIITTIRMSQPYEKEAEFAVCAVRRACNLTASVFNKLIKNETLVKGDKSPVTGALPCRIPLPNTDDRYQLATFPRKRWSARCWRTPSPMI